MYDDGETLGGGDLKRQEARPSCGESLRILRGHRLQNLTRRFYSTRMVGLTARARATGSMMARRPACHRWW